MATLRYKAHTPDGNVTVFLPDDSRIKLSVVGEEARPPVDLTGLTPMLIGRGRRIREAQYNRDFLESQVFALVDYPEEMRVWCGGKRVALTEALSWFEEGVVEMVFEYALRVEQMYAVKGMDDVRDKEGRI